MTRTAILVALLAIGMLTAHALGAGIERTEPAHAPAPPALLGHTLPTFRLTDCSELGKLSTEAARLRWADLRCETLTIP